ncbi:arogenate dehydrogenase 2, chloroplastic-like [Nymphaea colorata]|uniref:arogenate dehydrogenase 2, chloroplastic-like n=1 Tax=Nymphaea colorata TaxID=210225 RepID=UPI00129EA732|nr:arogenate dehydrogenase 2, chloroplastic-like [Nymphaea colorata]
MLTLPSLKPSFLSSSESHLCPSIAQSDAFSSVRYKWRSAGMRQKTILVKALDAAQAYDYEARMTMELERKSKLKIAVVGFGNFGQFIAKALVRQGHTVLAYSRSDYSSVAREMGVAFFSDAHDLCEEHPEVVLLCTSIISTEAVLRSLPLQRLKRSTLFVDVLSVKEFPRRLFLQILPPEFDILCTHPMFGPESGKNGWANLPFVYEKTRIGDEDARADRCDRFLEVFANEGCRMVEMSCAEHDRHAAETQFITHTVGRMLGRLQLQSTPINTKGYETLLNLVENTCGDSFDLYYGLFMYNVNATEQIERLEVAFDSLKKELFGHLHDILRRQIFDGDMGKLDGFPKKMVPALPENGYAKESKNVQEVKS